jgi:hypothetical protein
MSALARLRATIAEEQAQNAATPHACKTTKRTLTLLKVKRVAAFPGPGAAPDQYALAFANLSIALRRAIMTRRTGGMPSRA